MDGKYLIILLFILLCPTLVEGERKVKGSIYDYQHNPLVGVNISLKGSDFGTVSDIDGKFILDLPKQVGILVFNYSGFSEH